MSRRSHPFQDVPSVSFVKELLMPSGRAGHASWTIEPSSTCSTVTIVGDVEISVIAALRSAIDELLPTDGVVVVDVGGITFIDSTGLRMLMDVRVDIGAGGGAMFLRDVPPPVARVFDVTGMSPFFEHRVPMGADRVSQ